MDVDTVIHGPTYPTFSSCIFMFVQSLYPVLLSTVSHDDEGYRLIT